MSEKSSTFATEFERKGTMFDLRQGLPGIPMQKYYIFLNCANILTKKLHFL